MKSIGTKTETAWGPRILAAGVFLALAIFAFGSAPAPRAAAQTGTYCKPNLAVYPNGKDPCCPNNIWVCAAPSGTAGGVTSAPGGFLPVIGGVSCNPNAIGNFHDLVFNLVIGCILSRTILLIIALAVIVFLWGIARFIRGGEKDREAGKQFMLWGVIGLFVIVSLWALVSILSSTFNLNSNTIQVKTPNSTVQI